MKPKKMPNMKKVDTGERPVASSFESMPSLMRVTYGACKEYVVGKEVLDIGCGEGWQDLYLSSYAKHIHGIDIAKNIVEENNRKFANVKNMTFYHMSGEQLEFPDTFFDVIISSQSIEHLKDDRKFLEGVRRTLKIGGTFICTTPNKLSLIPEGEKPYDTPFYPFHVREYMPDQFFGLLQEYFGNIKKMSLINPNRDPEVAKNYRVKLIYRASRFRIIRWLGRMLSQKAKKSLYLFGNENLKSILKDTGTEYVNYSDAMVPECLCGICVKTSS